MCLWECMCTYTYTFMSVRAFTYVHNLFIFILDSCWVFYPVSENILFYLNSFMHRVIYRNNLFWSAVIDIFFQMSNNFFKDVRSCDCSTYCINIYLRGLFSAHISSSMASQIAFLMLETSNSYVCLTFVKFFKVS